MVIPSIPHKFGPWPPEPAGPARAGIQMQKQKENIGIEALKTKTIRTALKFLKKQENSTLESTKYLQNQIWAKLTPLATGDLAFSQVAKY